MNLILNWLLGLSLLAGNIITFHVTTQPPRMGTVTGQCGDCFGLDRNTALFQVRYRIDRGETNSWYITLSNVATVEGAALVYSAPLRIVTDDWQYAIDGCLLLEDVSGVISDRKGNSFELYQEGATTSVKICMPPLLFLPVITND